SVIWLLVAIIVIVYFASKSMVNVDERSSLDQPEKPTVDRPWQTYEYRSRKVVGRLSNKYELEKAGNHGRALNVEQSFHERGLIQANGRSYTGRIPARRKFVNQVKADWMKEFAQKVLRFQDPQTKLMVNHLGSFLIWRTDNQGQYAEEVELVLLLPGGKTSAAQGLVDSEKGTPLRYWNRSQQETELNNKLVLSLDPAVRRLTENEEEENAAPPVNGPEEEI
ncbi:MAG: hypothetical protein J6Y94_07230, partial [Bacteriovoracaceae bacterium]|nr:hypothetical protein [Bacteriovoracaceae bacterium]